ncbi:MAG: hypothetical protein AABY22_12530 [Nanoarchaeota archaeon]
MKKHDCLKWREEGLGCSICNGIVRAFSKEDVTKYMGDINWQVGSLKVENEKLKDELRDALMMGYGAKCNWPKSAQEVLELTEKEINED